MLDHLDEQLELAKALLAFPVVSMVADWESIKVEAFKMVSSEIRDMLDPSVLDSSGPSVILGVLHNLSAAKK